jgi:hypothetical protein
MSVVVASVGGGADVCDGVGDGAVLAHIRPERQVYVMVMVVVNGAAWLDDVKHVRKNLWVDGCTDR